MTVKHGSLALKSNDVIKEGITVAIRIRPLQDNARRVWKLLPEHASITQTDPKTGQPLHNPITGKTFFTFDKTFGEDIGTSEIYDSVAKRIVSSFLVSGLNGTIFAYGQTSSGKTYTMQGAGSIQEGGSKGAEGGIVHMAAKDIFNHIEQSSSKDGRRYSVRASFLEIYNEEVRDLLSGSTNEALPIRQDKKRGVFVQSVEQEASDRDGLLQILFEGEKSRAVASTGMNERSSRSHTIFRVTIESHSTTARGGDDSGDKENQCPPGSSDGAIRISTLNLVDLAGSESVRHTGATGDRQKEGGMINQSLLTLSRVFGALGKPNKSHVNFRDSKLTRLLQPALSGNSRMAVICCATPSEMYLEETRSTLQFASRAKLVKTNAKVNEFTDDKTTIKRLKQELAEARRCGGGGHPVAAGYIKELEANAESANAAATEASIKLDRLKALSARLVVRNTTPVKACPEESESSSTTVKAQRRRYSEGPNHCQHNYYSTPAKKQGGNHHVSQTEPRPHKKQKTVDVSSVSSHLEFNFVRDALLSKTRIISVLKGTVDEYSRLFQLQHQSELKSRDDGDIPIDLCAAQEENRQLKDRIIQLERVTVGMNNRMKKIQTTDDSTSLDAAESKHPAWPSTEDIQIREITAGHSIDMKASDTENFCTFQFGTLAFLVSKQHSKDAIHAFRKIFLPPVGCVLECPYMECTFRCRNPAMLCSHLERRAAGGNCSNEPTVFSQRGPHAFFLHETVVTFLKRCAQAKNIKPRDLLNPEGLPVAFGPTARHRWEGCSEELGFEKRMITKLSTRFPNGLLESIIQEKEAWFIQQEAKWQKKKRLDEHVQSKRPKQYPHLLTMSFLKLPQHWP